MGSTSTGKLKQLRIDQIRTDGGTQLREQIDRAVVEEYSRKIADLPPVVVYDDGKAIWLADGFHRIEAHVLANAEFIDCEVHQGTLRDAILYSVSANANHGIRRTNADKRKAVEKLLADEEWAKWSDRKIADQCGVSNQFVSNIRGELSVNGGQIEREVERNGTTYTMKVPEKKTPEVYFGDIPDSPEPTARDENARPDPNADELEKKRESQDFINDAPGIALAEEMRSLGKTPHEEAQSDPARRWCASLHNLYRFMNSTRNLGGIAELTKTWPNDARREYAEELRRIGGEIRNWIETIEA